MNGVSKEKQLSECEDKLPGEGRKRRKRGFGKFLEYLGTQTCFSCSLYVFKVAVGFKNILISITGLGRN